MSTRSYIGVLNDDNSVDYIYVHFDGYPEYNGQILVDHYNTEEQARGLIELGDFSSLQTTLAETAKEVYNEPKDTASHYKLWLNREHGNIEYIYLWKDNKWNCYHTYNDYPIELDLYSNKENSDVQDLA